MTDPTTGPQPQLVPSPEVATSPRPRSDLRRWFFGADGLRAGWSLAMYLVLVAALSLGIRFLLHHFVSKPNGQPTPWQMLAFELISLTIAVFPAIAMSRVEKRPFGSYGLPAPGAFRRVFLRGLVWGFVAQSLLLGMMRGFHVFYFGTLATHGVRALKFAAFWGVVFLAVGLFEEFLFRGYSLFTLRRGITFWPAAVLLSLGFGYVHLSNPGESWRGALSAGLIGLFFCFTLLRTGNLWFAVGMHASWDWAESFFYGVPDSGLNIPGHLLSPSFQGPAWLTGGTVGPEGSVLVFVVIAVLFGAFHVTHPEQKAVETRAP